MYRFYIRLSLQSLFFSLAYFGFGLGEGGDFHHKPTSRQAYVDAENQTLINHKCVCGALNRPFCQTRVTSCPTFCRSSSAGCDALSVRLGRHILLQALACVSACAACKCV
jgi:hypothetical protein